MALLAFNLTGAPVALGAGGPPLPTPVILPPSVSPPARGPGYNITAECRPDVAFDPAHGIPGGLTPAHYAAMSAQMGLGIVTLEWTEESEYLTSGLIVPTTGENTSRLRIFDDFLSVNSTGSLGWTLNVSGAGSGVTSSAASDGYPGILRLATGTTAAGRAGLRMQTSAVQYNPAAGKIILEWMANLSNLATAGNDYFAVIGWGDITGSGFGTDGVFFRYDFPSTNWFAVSRVGAVQTNATDTGQLVATGWRKFRIELDPGGARFYIGPPGAAPTLVAIIPVADLPSGALNLFGPQVLIRKQSGAGNRSLYIDYCLIDLNLEGVR